MRKIFFLTTAAGLAVAGLAAHADSVRNAATLAMNGEAGKAGLSSQLTPVKVDSKLYDYCAKVIDDVKKGKSSPRSTSYSAGDCIEIFISASIPGGITAAEPGQPGRGGDGGGIAGMPGGRGGAAGKPGQDGGSLPGAPGGKGGAAGGSGGASTAADVDEELLDYCGAVLKQSRPGASAKKPVESDEYEPSDCMDYFASLDPSNGGATGSSARSGAAGPSISGGQGGKGGKHGSGPGGASGGAGGAGVGGGTGGKGGAGGSGY
jgi:hypothetical protein